MENTDMLWRRKNHDIVRVSVTDTYSKNRAENYGKSWLNAALNKSHDASDGHI